MSDLSKRLGNLKEGARGVRSHRWFEGVDWGMVIRKEIKVRLSSPLRLRPLPPSHSGTNRTMS